MNTIFKQLPYSLVFVTIFCCSTAVFAQKPLTKPPKKQQTQQTGNNETIAPFKPLKTNRPPHQPSVKPQPIPQKPSSQSSTHVSNKGTINGHEYVDLGLSVKWATCNIGASTPSDYGNYYAWGEISTKTNYTEENSVTYGKEMDDISGDSRYDAARANWGGTWRMPTFLEMEELKEKCEWTWTTEGGHKGFRVTGPNGNSIFLPAANHRQDGLVVARETGSYWSSTPDDTQHAFGLGWFYGSSYGALSWGPRINGSSIRPVSQ